MQKQVTNYKFFGFCIHFIHREGATLKFRSLYVKNCREFGSALAAWALLAFFLIEHSKPLSSLRSSFIYPRLREFLAQ